MMDDPVKKLLALRVRDAERRLLRARNEYEISAARHEHEQAIDELERHRMSERG
jgi:hypothetical protein